MDRSRHLRDLEVSLARLVVIVGHDPTCEWRPHFERCLADTRELIASGFSQEQLNALSSSLTHVYGGQGSFNDYGPYIYDSSSGTFRAISGTEDFPEVATHVHDAALALRVVAHAL